MSMDPTTGESAAEAADDAGLRASVMAEREANADVSMDTDSIAVAFTSTTDNFDVDRAITDLHRLRTIRQALAMWEGELTDWLADALGRNQVTVDGVGTAEIKRGNDRKQWDNDALIRLVIARGRDERRVDEETGEYESEAEAVGRALMACARPSWRVTALKERGIDPDEYCEKTPGRLSVVIQ